CREPPVCSFAKQAAGIDCFFSRNSKGCGAEFHSTTECPPFPGRLKAVVALFPIAYPGEICPPEKIYDQQLLRGIAGANEGDLEGGIQQLRGVAPESAVRRGAQVSGAPLLSRGMGPSELGIWLGKPWPGLPAYQRELRHIPGKVGQRSHAGSSRSGGHSSSDSPLAPRNRRRAG